MDDFHWQKPPRPWALRDRGATLRLGKRLVPVASIAGVRARAVYDPNVTGHLMAVGIFLGVGSVFLLPVLMALARPKFLIGTVLFFGLGLAAISDLRRRRGIELYCLDLDLAGGETVTFSARTWAEIQALEAAIRSRTGRAG